MKLLSLLLCLPALLQSADHGAAPREAGTAAPWPQATSDVPVDPRVHFGHLDNGLRYAWANNAEPKERVYVRLHVDAGSFAERDDEVGMAHFLEHMAFNGSRHFAAGTLIEWFQEHGMSFGADTNAHTAFSETVYKLDLPNRDETTLREGLTVLRDFADGLTLADEEVQNEKGVIDGEERERDSAGFRTFRKVFEKLYAGTTPPNRLPIGTKPVRDAFTAESVRAFYTNWYRPENMTLVVVGDLRDYDPLPLITELFGDMQGPGTPVAVEPAKGELTLAETCFAVYDAELPAEQLSLSHARPYVDRPDTIAKRRADLVRAIARQMVNLRFSEKVKQEGTPYLDATVGTAGGFELLEGGDLTVECEPARWEEALTAAIVDLRTALEFGFQQPELDEVRAGMLRALDEAVEREPTAPSAALREALLQAAEDDVVPTDAKTDRDILRPVLEALTVEDCHAALVDEWSGEIRTLTAAGSLKLDDAPKELERVRAAAFDVDLEAPAEIAAAAFAYASDPERTGEVVQHDHVEDLDLHLVRFANGVQLNVKRTDFKERQILVRARVGDGRLGAAPEQLPAVELAGPTFSGGGLEAHSADDLRRLLAGKQVGVTLGVEDDHLALGGSTTGEDLLLELELLCAYLEHPGYRPDVLNVIDAQLPLIFEQYRHTVQGPLVFEFLPKLFTGNPRIGLLGMTLDAPLEKLQQVDMSGVRDLLAPQLATGPIEVSLVGDLDVDEAIALAARTLGTLPTRAAPADTSAARAGGRVVPGVEVKREIETADEKATVVMIFPTTDGSETPTRRNLFFLGQVVNDRLRVEVRERLGAAYSPFAASEASRTWDGVGGLMIQANGEPHQVDALVAACKAVGQDLAENGVGAEEVQRLAEPLLKQLRDLQRENTFWLGAIDTAQSRPESLDEHRNLAAFYEHLDAEALSALAARFLGAERASTLIVVPKTEESSGQ